MGGRTHFSKKVTIRSGAFFRLIYDPDKHDDCRYNLYTVNDSDNNTKAEAIDEYRAQCSQMVALIEGQIEYLRQLADELKEGGEYF